jgi:iron complex outermembrane recepter protein
MCKPLIFKMKSFFCSVFTLLSALVSAQTIDSLSNQIHLSDLPVRASRADATTPMTYSIIKKEVLEKQNLGQDIPYLLKMTPSVVETSDAGGGVGYTGIRIRGTDATRINVTINGIPLNDAESQGSYFVDLPDFASSTRDIQIQRGVGTSTNGAGAFGATINLNTAQLNAKPYGSAAVSYGTFNTLKTTASVGTGTINDHFTFDGRASRIVSDGYIDRASVNMWSFYTSAAYISNKNSLRLNVFSGKEITYQAWNGVPAQYIDDPKLRTFNVSGTADGTKKGTPHPNEVDNYRQTHAQLLYSTQLNTNFDFNAALHYTRGIGYYELYKTDKSLEKYGYMPIVSGKDTLKKSDFVERRWLDNHFYGATYALHWKSDNGKSTATLGGAANNYIGNHFGEAIWAEKFSVGPKNLKKYYQSNGEKRDFTIYGKLNRPLSDGWYGFLDIQYRAVNHFFVGTNKDIIDISQKNRHHFFNPKAGFFVDIAKNWKAYTSIAVGQREPNRDDYVLSTEKNRPKAEKMYDWELGTRFQGEKTTFAANFYYMYYRDQLVLTGAINDVGEPKRVNIPISYRAGVELEGTWQPNAHWALSASATLSANKIKAFTAYIDDWDNATQVTINHSNTNIAFSPSVIANYQIAYTPLPKLTFALLGKYVGQQYIDNTNNINTLLKAYHYHDFRVNYELQLPFLRHASVALMVNNILNNHYINNAWAYRYSSKNYDAVPDNAYTRSEGNGIYNQTGFFPQAGRYFLVGMKGEF